MGAKKSDAQVKKLKPRSSRKRASSAPRWGEAVQSTELQRELKRKAMLRQAGIAFNRKGFGETSMDDIASALNITKPTLYYYFNDKLELLFECLKTALLLGDNSKEIAEAHQGNARERLEVFIRSYISALTSELGSCAVLMEHRALRANDQKIVHKKRRKFDLFLRELVQEGIDEGSIVKQNSMLVVAFFMGSINTIPSWFSLEGPLTGEDIANAYVHILMGGLTPHS
jgi:TetR/AcrR family transcriptional regulator